MKKLIIVLLFAILAPSLVSAKRVGGIFGKSERVKEIMPLENKGPNGEEVYLAYKTTGYFFFMGAYFSDDGYVLGIRKSYGSYYPLDAKQIQQFQEKGFFPKPMPEYKIPIMDWVWGFSLWILLLVVAVIWFFPSKVRATTFEKGCIHYFGKGVPVDYNKAYKYFKKSSDGGFAPAQFNLGIMYVNSQGVTKDIEKAISYFMLASDQNYVNAQLQLGNLYFNGKEITKNVDRALSFYKDACTNGNQDACKMVSHITENKA